MDRTTTIVMTAECEGSGNILIRIDVVGTTAFTNALDCGFPARTTSQDLGRRSKGDRIVITVSGKGRAVYYVRIERT